MASAAAVASGAAGAGAGAAASGTGGSSTDSAVPAGHVFASVKEYVKRMGGRHPIRKILIANNGIGAVKAIRSIRRWAYQTFANEKMVYCTKHHTHNHSVFLLTCQCCCRSRSL